METDSRISRPLRAVIIGAGNVASQIAPALQRSGCISVEAVWSRTAEHARELAAALGPGVKAETELRRLPADAEFYLVSVADDVVAQVVGAMTPGHALWAHTAGSVEASVLAPLTDRYGVFYPLQTFSRGVAVEISEVPMFIEGSDRATADSLLEMARAISERVYEADSELRSKMHAAAVFACNFANHLWAMADDLLRERAGLDITVLGPLMRETLRKALLVPPAEAQTGPARRRDRSVMEKHISQLTPHQGEIYRLMSESIMQYYQTNSEK